MDTDMIIIMDIINSQGLEINTTVPEDYTLLVNDTYHTGIALNYSNEQAHAQSAYLAYQQFWYSSVEYQVYYGLKTYIPPVLIVLGTFANVFAVFVLRQYCFIISIAFYLALFTVVNTLVLYIGCGLEWIAYMTSSNHVMSTSDTACKLYQFFFSLIVYSSNWLVVLMLLDRVVYMCWPVYIQSICHIFTAKVLAVCLYVGLLSISIHSLWTYELTVYGCNIDPKQKDFQTLVWPWIAATLYSYLPLILALVLLVLLCSSLASNCSSRLSHSPDTFISPNRFIGLTISVSSVYLLLSLPTIVLNLIQYSNPAWLHSNLSYARLTVFAELFHALTCLKCGMCQALFFLYSPQLRRDLHSLLRYRCQRRYINASTSCNFEGPNMMLSPNGTCVETSSTSI